MEGVILSQAFPRLRALLSADDRTKPPSRTPSARLFRTAYNDPPNFNVVLGGYASPALVGSGECAI